MRRNSKLSPQAAVDEIERTSMQVQRRGHWPAWLFLAVAAATFVLVLLVGSGGHALGTALTPLPTLLAAAVVIVVTRQPVIGRDAKAINKPVVLAAVGTAVAGVIVDQTVLPDHFTWWLVLVAAFVVSPYLVGALRWLQR